MGLDNPIHIAFLLILLLLVFGAKRLPEMGRSLGAGMRGFKDSLTGENTEHALTSRAPEPAEQASDTASVHVVAPVAVAEPAVTPAAESGVPVVERLSAPRQERETPPAA
jgi:sec-independent protein translocase protein TatA